MLVLNQTLAKRGVTNTGQDDFVLDKAFALIEGFWEAPSRSRQPPAGYPQVARSDAVGQKRIAKLTV
jgi:hypothetical protein